MARPTYLTAQLRAEVERELAGGCTQAEAARRTGVSARSLRRWIALGQVERRRPLLPPEEPPDDVPIPERVARAEPGLVAAILRSAQGGSWQAAAWLLERSFPDRWGRPEGRPPARPPDAFDELAVARRRRRDDT